MKRVFIGVALVLVAALAGVYFFRGEIALALLRRGAADGIRADRMAALPDGLHAVFCGTGAPLPDRTRAGPCTGVVAGDKLFLFDVGEGAAETLSLMGFLPAQVDAVFLTHLHSDHFDGIMPMALQRWASGAATSPMPVYGPQGVERVAAGFNEAYAIDSGYRIAHHGEAIVPRSGFGLAPHPFAMPEGADRAVVYDEGGVTITAFLVQHAPVTGAVGYRVDYAGRSLVISGDTAKAASVAREARGADLLIHEALSPELSVLMGNAATASGRAGVGQIFHDILDYHASPAEAAETAQEAGVGALALTHILPPLAVPGLEGPFLGDARSKYRGPLWIMRDGDVISLPRAGGVERSHFLR